MSGLVRVVSMAPESIRIPGALCLCLALSLLPISNGLKAEERQDASALWRAQITPLVVRPHAEPEPLGLYYEVSWSQLMQAGTIRIDIEPRGDDWIEASAEARSMGGARLLWPYESHTEARIAARTLYPVRLEHVQTEHGEQTAYQVRYGAGAVTLESTTQTRDGAQTERDTRPLPVERIRDILSTLLFLRQSELNAGQRIRLLVQPLESLFLVTFKVIGPETREVLGKTWKTIRLEMSLSGIGEDFAPVDDNKLRGATFWLSDDAHQVPVEIQADLFIGYVSMRLAGLDVP